jgi:hypothetical protein
VLFRVVLGSGFCSGFTMPLVLTLGQHSILFYCLQSYSRTSIFSFENNIWKLFWKIDLVNQEKIVIFENTKARFIKDKRGIEFKV